MAKTQWNRVQLACALSEISLTARALQSIGIMRQSALQNEGAEDEEALDFASQCLAQRIGWLADMAAECGASTGGYVDRRSPLEWSMPPVFADRRRA